MSDSVEVSVVQPMPDSVVLPMPDSIEVSVVLPCLDEARTLGDCIDKAKAGLAAAGVTGEIVVSDNGSTDGSIEIAATHGARVVHAPLRGYGHALRHGIAEARGAFIVMGDADDSYDFGEIPSFVAKWREGWEIVMGNRFRGGIREGAMPALHRYVGNPLLSGLLNLFFRSGIGDAHCGMRGFTADAYRRLDLRTTGMEFASEFVIKAARLGMRMTEVPITLWPDRRGRPPHLRSFPDGWRHLRFMLLYAPNWLFLAPGLLLSGTGFALVVWLVGGPRRVGSVELDVHTMFFGMIFVLLGAQIVATGLFAKMFSHSERFQSAGPSLERLLGRVTLETGLVVGAVLTLVGAIGDAIVVRDWAASGFGEFQQMRQVIFWSMWLFLGLQAIFASFFLSMLGISRGTYIGDYDK
jgi:hypothetical protein